MIKTLKKKERIYFSWTTCCNSFTCGSNGNNLPTVLSSMNKSKKKHLIHKYKQYKII